jgi:hypothetical protein
MDAHRPFFRRRTSVAALLALVVAFLAISASQWAQPAIEDEVLHHRCKVVWYEQGAAWCELAHTPFYHEATSLWQRIFGPATMDQPGRIAVLRSFGTFTALLTLGVFLLGLSLSAAGGAGSLAAAPVAAAALLLLHPYFIQGSLHFAHDTTIQQPLLLLSIVLIELAEQRKKSSLALTLGISVALGFALFAKELTPLVVIALWPLRALLVPPAGASRPDHRRFFHAIAGGALALFFFFLLMYTWAWIRGFHWYDPLLLTFNKVSQRATGAATVGPAAVSGRLPWNVWGGARFLFLSYVPLVWFGPAFVFALAILPRVKPIPKLRKALAAVPFSLWCVAGIFAAYTWLVQAAFYFPQYTASCVPVFLYGCARYLKRPSPAKYWDSPEELMVICAAACIVGGLEFFDPLLIIEHRTELRFGVLARHLAGIGIPLALLAIARHRWRDSGPVLLVLIAYFIGTDVGHLKHRYNTRYLYGERGFEETLATVRALKASVSPNAPVLSAPRDIDWALQKDSRLLDFEIPGGPAPVLSKHRIVVSRSYGFDSLSQHPQWLELVRREFRCHDSVSTPGHRFEWWWKCSPGTQPSKH